MPLTSAAAVNGVCLSLQTQLQEIRDLCSKDDSVAQDATKARSMFAQMQDEWKSLENILNDQRDFIDGD